MTALERLRDGWEANIIELLPREVRYWYYTKFTKWPTKPTEETFKRLSNEGYIQRRLNSMTRKEVSQLIEDYEKISKR